MGSTRRLNDMDPYPLAGYASGADATGYPLRGAHHRPYPVLGDHPGASAAGGVGG